MTSKVILLALLSLLESQEQKQTEKHGVGDTDAKTLIQETCRAAGTLCDELLQALSTGGYPETRDRILNDLAAFANSNRARLLRILFLLTSAESATTTNELDGLRLGGDAGPACSAFLEDQVALQTHIGRVQSEVCPCAPNKEPDLATRSARKPGTVGSGSDNTSRARGRVRRQFQRGNGKIESGGDRRNRGETRTAIPHD